MIDLRKAPIVTNEVTKVINGQTYMSVEDMIDELSQYTLSFLEHSRDGIALRHLVRYDEAVCRIYEDRII